MNINVSWGDVRFKGNPTIVYREISGLGDEVKPKQIAGYAEEHPESELHKCFTWDNDIAADKYRLFEARQIQCNLKITYTKDDSESKPQMIRAFFRTDTKPESGYKQTVNILRNENEYQGMLLVAKNELKSFERKYAMLTELEDIFKLIREL